MSGGVNAAPPPRNQEDRPVPAPLVCPIHREPLVEDGEGRLVGAKHGEVYPVVGGIPVLLPDRAERREAAQGDWTATRPRPLDFYNRTDDHDGFCRTELDDIRADMTRYLDRATATGPVLEIGSGKGALQGFGGDYTALDYALTALGRYVRPEHRRVCGTAERLPFPDGVFRFVFSIAALEHVPGADRAFAEIERVLAPGGVAYLAPAWHCVQYNCEGIPVRPYRDLDLRQKLVKLTLPLRRSLLVKAAGTFPARFVRRSRWSVGRAPTELRFERLTPDYQTFWMSDSDAASRIDSHEGCLFFASRGYDVLRSGPGAARQLLFRHGALVARKPSSQGPHPRS
jgi:SAM-dependent methyltransferase